MYERFSDFINVMDRSAVEKRHLLWQELFQRYGNVNSCDFSTDELKILDQSVDKCERPDAFNQHYSKKEIQYWLDTTLPPSLYGTGKVAEETHTFPEYNTTDDGFWDNEESQESSSANNVICILEHERSMRIATGRHLRSSSKQAIGVSEDDKLDNKKYSKFESKQGAREPDRQFPKSNGLHKDCTLASVNVEEKIQQLISATEENMMEIATPCPKINYGSNNEWQKIEILRCSDNEQESSSVDTATYILEVKKHKRSERTATGRRLRSSSRQATGLSKHNLLKNNACLKLEPKQILEQDGHIPKLNGVYSNSLIASANVEQDKIYSVTVTDDAVEIPLKYSATNDIETPKIDVTKTSNFLHTDIEKSNTKLISVESNNNVLRDISSESIEKKGKEHEQSIPSKMERSRRVRRTSSFICQCGFQSLNNETSNGCVSKCATESELCETKFNRTAKNAVSNRNFENHKTRSHKIRNSKCCTSKAKISDCYVLINNDINTTSVTLDSREKNKETVKNNSLNDILNISDKAGEINVSCIKPKQCGEYENLNKYECSGTDENLDKAENSGDENRNILNTFDNKITYISQDCLRYKKDFNVGRFLDSQNKTVDSTILSESSLKERHRRRANKVEKFLTSSSNNINGLNILSDITKPKSEHNEYKHPETGILAISNNTVNCNSKIQIGSVKTVNRLCDEKAATNVDSCNDSEESACKPEEIMRRKRRKVF